MKILGLDISSKTGFAVLDFNPETSVFSRLESGTIPKTSEPTEKYPKSYILWAQNSASLIIEKIAEVRPDVIVIEETSKGSKNAMSQKILEFIHFIVACYMVDNNMNCHYLMTGEWRGLTGCAMTKEEKKRNSSVKKQHDKGLKVAKDEKGKRIGRITKKHVNIRKANEIFKLNLMKKDEDQADALLLALGWIKKTHDITW